jgi:hypothetical protein
MDELPQRKLEAEIASIQAQTSKAAAETAKLQAEQKTAQRTFGGFFVESLKVFGALIVGAGGVMTAITGYQLAEIRKEKMELSMEKLSKELRLKTDELETAMDKKKGVDAATDAAQQQLVTTQTELDQLRTVLVALKNAAPPQTNTDAIDQAILRTEKIGESVASTDSQLRTATAESSPLPAPQEWQVVIGDYADQKEAGLKQDAARKLGYSNSEIYGQPPHLHMRFRFPTKAEAAAAAQKLKVARIAHEPDVLPYRGRG